MLQQTFDSQEERFKKTQAENEQLVSANWSVMGNTAVLLTLYMGERVLICAGTTASLAAQHLLKALRRCTYHHLG